ncbi:hypothetical protein KHS38_12525 [Mucilaginibacter sp. Bleaf8]|uniref:hypothetical protein n=1 Tax=Mucilaginibacter sp. Bleaf8 TaxID=2834430 RepID=UPI001BCF0FB5|nr:hypothetical protein [Mucilaginibacter sp. Bleaf8]MBS7565230.1 hypothetical protein [Mucilaginibacter sp. Bleaf8]
MNIKQENTWGELGSALGKGLLAGLAGTAAITLSQMIEMSITKRKPSDAPAKVASEITDVQPTSEETKAKVNQEIHWAYGTSWGVARGLIGLTGLKGLPASLLHFGAIWGTALVMLPKYDAAPPVTEEPPKTVAIDALHHAVYALAAGLVYDALDAGNKHQRKFDHLIEQLHLKGILSKLKP